MAQRLFAIALLDALHGDSPAPETAVVSVRDLAAVVQEAPWVMTPPDEDALERHHAVVEAVFTRAGAVLPTPAGTVFRDGGTLRQWLELHYVALTDALAFVEDRAEARVHVQRASGPEDEREAGSDLAALAADCFRTLRRRAVASLPLRTEHVTGVALTSAFLVDRSAWASFESLAREEHGRHAGLEVTVTGPWPAYDFVRIHFGR